MTRAWIIHPGDERGQTLGLLPGGAYFKTQLTKNGPWVAVKTEVVEPRNAEGEIDGDCTYKVWIGGNEIPWDRWKTMTLIGEPLTEPEYNYVLKALAWDKANLGLDERKAVDLMAMPPISPPRMPVVLTPEDGPMALTDEPPPISPPVGCVPPKTEVVVDGSVIFMTDTDIYVDGLSMTRDTPAASALADAILPPIDVEIEE